MRLEAAADKTTAPPIRLPHSVVGTASAMRVYVRHAQAIEAQSLTRIE